MPFLIILLVLLAIALVILISNIAIVPQAYVYVLERMGVYFLEEGIGVRSSKVI